MIILGIDPGTTRIGYGFIKVNGNKSDCIGYGILKNLDGSSISSHAQASQSLSLLINKYKPDMAAVEKLFFFKNRKTITSVGEMRGVIMLTLANHNLPINEYTPLQVKQAVSSYGRADKDQVQIMVKLVLGLKEKVRPDDAADALAVAICCANSSKFEAI